MLFLIGLGLDIGDISEKGLSQLKLCQYIFLDPYTNKVAREYIDYIEKETGKKVVLLGRSDLEEKAKETLKNAKTSNVAILVSGDPLIATTHHTTLIDLASKEGIGVKVFHAASIFSAAMGASGLDVYKFGPTTTIPFWSEKYKPVSFMDVIGKNLANGEHTLVLLDYDYKKEKGLSLLEAIDLLERARGIRKVEFDKLVVLGDVGKEGELIMFGSISVLKNVASKFENKIISIIVPASLNFSEEEALSKYLFPISKS
ncbi:MAG: diphthine synthase [Candidatus Micrarchaeia archaeon]